MRRGKGKERTLEGKSKNDNNDNNKIINKTSKQIKLLLEDFTNS